MKKAIAILGICAVLSFGVYGCGSSASDAQESTDETAAAESTDTSAAAKDFDGSGCVDTGEGTMILKTPGGDTEGGNIPQVACNEGLALTQFTVVIEGMDNSICTLYVDGIENEILNACDSESTFTIEGEGLEEGVHTVELVRMDGDEVAIYKSAQYEMVY